MEQNAASNPCQECMTGVEMQERLSKAFPACTVKLYPASVAKAASGATLAMAEFDGEDRLVCHCNRGECCGLSGTLHGEWLVCALTHANRLVLNALLVDTAPCALGRVSATVGLGDRLGLAGDAQLAAIAQTRVKPVLAQQSMREMQLTGRTFDDVIDAASFAVFRSGWREGWGADGDHLKNADDIARAVAAGCTMITLDCSDALNLHDGVESETLADCFARYARDEGLRELGLPVDEALISAARTIYGGAIRLARRVWQELLLPAGRAIDFEISLDETAETTTYFAHYYVANELATCGVTINSLAPRFVGAFHKGVDYQGDLQEFSANFLMHQRIASHFGHKLSVHSGSDKFSVFPIIGAHSGARFHLKTSGTNWLSAARVLAQTEPALFRRMAACAIAHFDEARRYYEVHAQLDRVPDIESLPDAALPELFEQPDSRQLIHITYGFLIGRDAPLRAEIFAALKKRRQEVDAAICAHIERHILALGMQRKRFAPRLCLTLTREIIGSAPFLCEGDFCAGVRQAKAYGYNCVEIHVANPDELALERLMPTLRETGMAVSALGTGRVYVNDGLSLIDGDPAVRAAALERLLRFIDAAEALRCVVIIGCLRGNIPAAEQAAECLSRLAESVREADAYAKKRGVTIVFEPINRYENNFLCTAREIVAFIEENRLESTRILLDAFHMNIEEADPVETVERYAPYVAYFHAADSNRLTPGEGHLNFRALFGALAASGYQGDISAECLPRPTKEQAAKNWIQNVKSLLASLPE